ncbi:MAG: hypothetical protein Q7S40_30950 [Opitutaceae bacterium]|nr:hypothetical protein [Opitutaceae bacterium]
MPRQSELWMPAIVPQHQDTHFTANNSKKEMVPEYVKPSATNVVLKEAEVSRVGRDPIFRGLYFSEKLISQLGAAFPVEVFEREPKVGLNRAVKMQIHLPSPRRSSSQVIDNFGSFSICSSRRRASATPSSSSSRIGGKPSSKSAASSAFSLVDNVLACCRIS